MDENNVYHTSSLYNFINEKKWWQISSELEPEFGTGILKNNVFEKIY
jgi:hypothetical protein